MTVLEMARVDKITETFDLATLFPNLTGPFTSAGVALLPRGVRPNGSTVFQSLTIAAGKVTVMFAGPDASSSGAVVATGDADAYIEVATSDGQVDTAKAVIIRLIGGGAVPTPLPLPQVLSVNGQTGAVSLTASDVGAATPTDLTTGLATKVNSSTYTTGLAGKQDKATLGADVAADPAVRAAYVPLLLTGSYASRPAAGSVTTGQSYFATDVQETYTATGTAGQSATGWAVTGPSGAELGYAETTSDFSTASQFSWVPVPGATVTITVGERPVAVEIQASVLNGVGDANVAIFQDGAEVARVLRRLADTSEYAVLWRKHRVAGLTPGSTHTWDVRLYNQSGQNVTFTHFVPGPVVSIGVTAR